MQSIGFPHKLTTFFKTSVGTIKTLPCKTKAQYAALVIDIPELTQTPVLDQYCDSIYKLPVSFQRKSLFTSTVRRPVRSERTNSSPSLPVSKSKSKSDKSLTLLVSLDEFEVWRRYSRFVCDQFYGYLLVSFSKPCRLVYPHFSRCFYFSPIPLNPFMSTIITISFIFLTGFYSVCVVAEALGTLVFKHVGV